MKITIDYKLYEIRIKKRLTIRELSRISGVSKSMINNIENNKSNPSVLIICQLAVALKINASDLFSYCIK
jgi:transcriptional regulator with XRE-family HTH domain